jgi:glutathione S-transferase
LFDAGAAAVAQEKVMLPMLTVRTSFGSPFGRKARIAVSVLGLDDKVKVESATTQDPADPLRQQNPLGKIPVLVLDDGSAIYDSPVILEYLDHLAGGGKIIPKDFNARIDALKLQALADGIMDASILIVYEGRYRPPEKPTSGSTCRPAGRGARNRARAVTARPRYAAPYRPDHAGLCARLSGVSFPRRVDEKISAPLRLARDVRRARAVVRRDQAAAGIERVPRTKLTMTK